MADEQNEKPEQNEEKEKKRVSESLRDWGFDAEKFQERAKESLENARGDLSEITGTLRHTLVQAKDIVVGLQKNGAPVAAEIKSGFERAWHEIENACKAARDKAKKPEASAAESAEPSEPAQENQQPNEPGPPSPS